MIKKCNLNFVCQIIADEIDNNSEILNILGDDFTDNTSFYGNDQRNEEGNDFTGDQENKPEREEKPIAGIGRVDSKDQRSKEEVDNLFIDYGYESQINHEGEEGSLVESTAITGSKEAAGEIQQEVTPKKQTELNNIYIEGTQYEASNTNTGSKEVLDNNSPEHSSDKASQRSADETKQIVAEIQSSALSQVKGLNIGKNQAIHLDGRSDHLIMVIRKGFNDHRRTCTGYKPEP